MEGTRRAAVCTRQCQRAVCQVATVILLAPLLLLLPGSAAAQADSVSDRHRALNNQLDDLREALEGTSDELVNAAVKLKETKADLDDARDSLSAAHVQLADAQARDAALAQRLALAQAAVDKAQRELDARRAMETATRNRIGTIARETYVSSGLSGLSIALNAESPEQFADRVTAAGTALRGQNGAIAKLRVQQAETRARQGKLDAARAEVARLKRESEAVVRQKQAAEQKAAVAEASIHQLALQQDSALGVIKSRKTAEKQRIAALQAEEDKLAAILRARARRTGHAGGGNGSGTLSYPVRAPITSGFGWRYHPILHYSRLHAGTDFGAACGTPVRAAAGGSIVRAGWSGGFGNQVVIDHGRMRGKSVSTSYNHLSRITKHWGPVARGQIIGYSGTTGLSTGCHLHFEVYVNGTHVNPMGWL